MFGVEFCVQCWRVGQRKNMVFLEHDDMFGDSFVCKKCWSKIMPREENSDDQASNTKPESNWRVCPPCNLVFDTKEEYIRHQFRRHYD